MRVDVVTRRAPDDAHVRLRLGSVVEDDRALRLDEPAVAERALQRPRRKQHRRPVHAALRLLHEQQPVEQLDPVAGKYLPPLSRRLVVVFADGRSLLAETAERQGDEVVVRHLDASERHPADRIVNLRPDGLPPERLFLLGTDKFSRDLWSRLVWGARISLTVGLIAVALAVTLGVAVGSAAAVGGPLVDGVLMRAVDAILSVPRLFLILALVQPKLLAPLNRAWTRFGLLLGAIVAPIVMGVIYFGLITPMALLARLLGKDFLRLKRDPAAATYWLQRQDPRPSPERLRDQF